MRKICFVLTLNLFITFLRAAPPATQTIQSKISDVMRAQVIDQARNVVVVGGKPSVLYNRRGVGPCFFATVDAANGEMRKRVDLDEPTVRGILPAGNGREILLWGDYLAKSEHPRMSPAPYLAMYDVFTGKEISRLGEELDFVVRAAAVNTDATRALTAQDSRALRLWNAQSGEAIRTIETGHNVQCVALSGDGKTALLGGGWNDENIYLWDLQVNQELRRFIGHHGVVTSVSFSSDEKNVLSTSMDGTVRLWDGASGAELRRLRVEDAPVYSATFSPDDSRVLAIMTAPPRFSELYMQIEPGREVRLWDLASAKLLETFNADAHFAVTSIGFTEDARTAVAAGENRIWRWPLPPADAKKGVIDTPSLPDEPSAQLFCLDADEISAVGFLPSGEAWSAGHDNSVSRWDIANGRKVGTNKPAKLQQWPQVQAISPDGRFAVSFSQGPSNEAFLWELASGLQVARFTPKENFHTAAFSPDSALLIFGATPRDGPRETVFRFYHTADGADAGKIAAPVCAPVAAAFTPDGNSIAVSSVDGKNVIHVFELDTAKRLASFKAPSSFTPTRIAFSQDGKRLAASTSAGFAVWNVDGQEVLWQQKVLGGVESFDFSSDGRRILTGGKDTNIRLWDVAQKKQIGRFDEHRYPMRVLKFSPDGRRAVSGSHEKTFRVWKLPE